MNNYRKIIFYILSPILAGEFLYRIENKIVYGYNYYSEQILYHTSETKSLIAAMPLAIIAFTLMIYICNVEQIEMVISKRKFLSLAPINLDKIPYDDKEWIEEIKLRKQRGDKMAAYSSKGEAAAKRKARALGLEDCFVAFLDEEEVKKKRGWG